MRKIVIMLLAFLALDASAQQGWVPHRRKAFRAAGGTNFSDDFNRTDGDSLGSNWSEVTGDIDISSNTAAAQTASGLDLAVWTANTVGETQYVGLNETAGGGGTHFLFVFRYTDSSSVYYEIALDNSTGGCTWRYRVGTGGSPTTIQSANLSDWTNFNQLIGVTVEGTGNQTVVRIWGNCTGLPSAADTWNGDNTPSLTFTDNPGTAANTGTRVGMGATNSGGGVTLTDFYGGSF
jgi:hypothetical protein